MKNIIFFKSPKLNDENKIDDPYNEVFKNDGYNIEFIKVLKITNSFDCLNKLIENNSINNNKYFGLIFTSSNSIKSLDSFLNNNNNNNEFFNKYLNFKFIYIVGETSLQLFKSTFSNIINFNKIIIKSGSNAINLSKIIKNDYDENNLDEKLQLLYFCGNNRREELPNFLKENKIQCQEIIVYNSETFDESLNSIKELYNRILMNQTQQNQWCVFFSPSGVEYVIDTINQLSSNHGNNNYNNNNNNNESSLIFWNNIKIAAIGKTTEQSLKKFNLKVDVVSPLPNYQSVFNSITEYNNNNNK